METFIVRNVNVGSPKAPFLYLMLLNFISHWGISFTAIINVGPRPSRPSVLASSLWLTLIKVVKETTGADGLGAILLETGSQSKHARIKPNQNRIHGYEFIVPKDNAQWGSYFVFCSELCKISPLCFAGFQGKQVCFWSRRNHLLFWLRDFTISVKN